VLDDLKRFYGLQPLPPADPFSFFVWEILSEGAVAARRDQAWRALARIPALTPDAIFRTPEPDLRGAVQLAGADAGERLARLRATADIFRRYRGDLEKGAFRRSGVWRAWRALERLEHLPTPMRARALLFCGDHAVLPLDDDLRRVAARLSGIGARRRTVLRRWILARTGQTLEARREAVVYLRHHARQTCLPIGPHCDICPVREGCAWRSRPSLRG
jgi:endonuclease III